MFAQIDRLQPFGEHVLRHAARPFVEVAEHDLGTGDTAIVDDRRQLDRLMPSLE
jgi:hypothetical protein